MIRLTTIAASILALGLSNAAWGGDPAAPSKTSAAQAMMDQADKTLEQTDIPKNDSTRPIVVAGKKAAKPAAPAVPTAQKTDIAPSAGPVKIVEGSGTIKTTLAPAELSDPRPPAPVSQPIADTGMRSKPVRTLTPVSSTGLPGLGTPASGPEAVPAKPIVVHAQNGVNEMVTVSTILPNRIATPFAKPKVIDFSPTEYQVKGSDIFLVPKGETPIGIFIRDDRPDSPTVALTLVPKKIPGVTVLVNIDGAYRSTAAAGKASEEDRAPTGYEDSLRKIMRRMALERPVSGYTETNIDAGAAMIGPLRIVPEKQFSGQLYDIYRYRIINTEKESIELSEESFYRKGVKAVAFYPAVRLDSWQSTKVFIVSGKDGADDEH